MVIPALESSVVLQEVLEKWPFNLMSLLTALEETIYRWNFACFDHEAILFRLAYNFTLPISESAFIESDVDLDLERLTESAESISSTE